jgi:two-component system nitrate/nitrite response regulator NarL
MERVASRNREKPKRVLVVDDVQYIRKLLCDFLEEAEFVVCGEASNGQAAIESAAELKPDVIILDASMPVMTGIQAAPRLKKLLPSTSIILFTAHEFMMQGVNPRELGVDAVVNKDRGMDALGECLSSLHAGRVRKTNPR